MICAFVLTPPAAPDRLCYMKRKLKVGVLMTLDTTYKYDIVRGIIQFAKQHDQWSLYGQNRVLHNLTDLRNWKGDGIIAHITSKKEADKLASLGLPIVDVCGSVTVKHDRIIYYTNDDFLTGANVAHHFLKEGFTEFAFVGVKLRRWSMKRKNGFASALPPTHPGPLVFERTQEYWSKNEPNKDLIQWLKQRPLAPLAIMAADDLVGAQIIEACNIAKIHIPNEISVIGTNNNVIVCEFCNPPLSSIPLNCLQIGIQAAASLHELMTVRKNETVYEAEKLPPLPIVARNSVSYENANNSAVRDAMNFIRQNKGVALTVSDVINHCKVGRRTLEINFKKICGHSIYEEICQQKIHRACVLLQRSTISITEIAFDSGFNSYQRFHSFFRKYIKTTPKQYRQKYRLDPHIS
jgi:LacI family transcriptional regulator